MTYAGPHFHLTWGGAHYTSDTWSCGVRLWDANYATAPPDPSIAVPASVDAVTDAATAITTWVTSSATNLSPYSYLSWVKLNWVNASGHQFDGYNTTEHLLGTPVHNASGTPTNPASSLVVTLTTYLTRGRGSHGRLYLPIGHVSTGANGNIDSSSVITNILTSTKDLINALNGSLSWDTGVGAPKVAVMSTRSARNNTSGPGPAEVVLGLELGHVLDVQRRRRRQLEENYSPMSLT